MMSGLGAWVAFDAFALVETLLTQPLLIIAGSEAGSLWHSKELYAKAPGPKSCSSWRAPATWTCMTSLWVLRSRHCRSFLTATSRRRRLPETDHRPSPRGKPHCYHSSSGKKQMLRKTSLVLAIAAALMLPSATFGKGGGPRGGYHGHYYGHGVWGHCWPGGGWRYGGWSGYGCWQWTPDGSICWICG